MGADQPLRDFFAAPVEMSVGGKDLRITPLRAKMFWDALALSEPFLGDLVQIKNGGSIELDIIRIGAQHGHKVNELTALLAREPVEWVDELPLDDLLKLSTAVIEVNRDFFSQRLLPAFKSAWSQLIGKWSSLLSTVAMPAVGPTSSSG